MITVPKLPLSLRIRHHIARYLLPEEVAKVDLERETFLRLQRDLQGKIREFEAYKESLSLTDLVREKMNGFNPRLLDEDVTRDEDGKLSRGHSDLPEILGEVEAQDDFLSKCKSLSENSALHTIIDYLIRNQLLFSMKEAQTLDTINFGRATVNGASLVREEVTRLATIYAERHPADKPVFDEHEVM